MNQIFNKAAQLLGFRQQAYQSVFTGSHMQKVLVDLAKHSRAFDADIDGLSRDDLLIMHGRRQHFFRIIKHLKLSPTELEQVYQPALVQAARRIQTQGADND